MSKLTEMEYDELLRFKKILKDKLREAESKMSSLQQVLDDQYEAVCYACEDSKFAYDDLPKGWGYLIDDKYPVLLCDKCIANWEDRWLICKTTRGDL